MSEFDRQQKEVNNVLIVEDSQIQWVKQKILQQAEDFGVGRVVWAEMAQESLKDKLPTLSEPYVDLLFSTYEARIRKNDDGDWLQMDKYEYLDILSATCISPQCDVAGLGSF